MSGNSIGFGQEIITLELSIHTLSGSLIKYSKTINYVTNGIQANYINYNHSDA